ncbi:hypothetical protein QQX98_005785 [Neonectria punicea]|uniref:Uncharacterized protein n=1 Tax=Neonectria punicea TaxID=979145 RepID=A0ABR1H347_9HYPO
MALLPEVAAAASTRTPGGNEVVIGRTRESSRVGALQNSTSVDAVAKTPTSSTCVLVRAAASTAILTKAEPMLVKIYAKNPSGSYGFPRAVGLFIFQGTIIPADSPVATEDAFLQVHQSAMSDSALGFLRSRPRGPRPPPASLSPRLLLDRHHGRPMQVIIIGALPTFSQAALDPSQCPTPTRPATRRDRQVNAPFDCPGGIVATGTFSDRLRRPVSRFG